jgi:nicotinamide-nucleotide amidase
LDSELYRLAVEAGRMLQASGRMLVTAESCTGGWVAEAITMVPGSSQWFERGFITYTNLAKQDMLGVRPDTLERYGAVSEPTVREMVAGALANSPGDVALAVSGVAGPSGGTAAKPVGMVCLAWGLRGGDSVAVTRHFPGDREAVRRDSVIAALEGLIKALQAHPAS